MTNLVANAHPSEMAGGIPGQDLELSLMPPTEPPYWRSIVGDARSASGFSTRRGRSRETDRFQTGDADWELNNRDRYYDPNYTSSPLYGHVLPERRVRMLARRTTGGTSYGTVAHDAFSSSSAGTGTLSWTHTPAGTPKGVVVFVVTDGAAHQTATATYGGVPMSPVTSQDGALSVAAFFLGSGLPTGAQTVAVTVSGASTKRGGAYTVTNTSGDTEIHDSGELTSGSTNAPAVALTITRTSQCYGALGTGVGNPSNFASASGYTTSLEHDFGANGASWELGDAVTASDASVAWTQNADTAQAVAVAITGALVDTTTNTNYVVFDGYADGFEQKYGSGAKDKTAILSAGDGFKVLAQAELEGISPWALALPETYAGRVYPWFTVGDLALWCRFNDTTSTLRDDSGDERHGSYSGTPTFTTSLVEGDDNPAWTVTGGVTASTTLATAQADGGIAFWMSTTATTGTIFQADFTGTNVVAYLSGGTLRVYWSTGAGYVNSAAVNDGTTHFIAISLAGIGPGMALYVDGTLVDSSISAASAPSGLTLSANQVKFGDNAAANDPYVGTLDEFFITDDLQGSGSTIAATVAALYEVGSTPWTGDYTGERAQRLLNVFKWDSTDVDVDTGNSIVEDVTSQLTGSVLDYVQNLAESEQGQTYMGLDGAMSSDDHFKFVHRARHSMITGTRSSVSNATFGENNLPYADVLFDYGEQRVYNRAIVQRAGGNAQSANDSTSQDKFFLRTYNKSGLLYASDNDSFDHATWIVNRYSDPEFRPIGLVIKPAADPTNLWPQVLGREIGDRITVKSPGDAVTVQCIIEGVEHSMSDGDWVTTWRLSVADLTSYLVLDDAVLGVLDANQLAF